MSATYLSDIIKSQEREIEQLKRWKKESLEVMPDFKAIGKALNIPLGQTVHDKILPGIERLNDQVKDLEQMLRDAYEDIKNSH